MLYDTREYDNFKIEVYKIKWKKFVKKYRLENIIESIK